MLFGNENAEKDDLLYECFVDISSTNENSQIFTGRWGTGKSACLFLRNKELRITLSKIEKHQEDIWYINEKAIDADSLREMRGSCKNSKDFIYKAEKLWQAEIVRAAILVLGMLREHYNPPQSNHWKFVTTAYKGGKITSSLWSNLVPITKFITSDDKKVAAVKELQGNIEDLFSEEAFHCVQHCLEDIAQKEPKIAIGVEPIETPQSPLENAGESIAQDVVAALINAFISNFQESHKQLLKVYVAIPWHRNKLDGIIYPQKKDQYECKLDWEKDELKTFINSRIEWEFRKVKRRCSNDVWYDLFEEKVKNDHCSATIYEDSFDYILRHTHHRPREIQKLTRRSVEKYARKTNRSITDIMQGKGGGLRIPQSVVKEMIRGYCSETFKDYLVEVERRYPDINDYTKYITGITVPFTIDDVKNRMQKYSSSTNVIEVIKKLWEVGIVGLEISIKDVSDTDKMYEKLKLILNEKAHVVHEDMTTRKKYHRWYAFYYNWKIDPFELMQRHEGDSELKVMCVLHPRTFEVLPGRVTSDWPIGI